MAGTLTGIRVGVCLAWERKLQILGFSERKHHTHPNENNPGTKLTTVNIAMKATPEVTCGNVNYVTFLTYRLAYIRRCNEEMRNYLPEPQK